MENNENVEVETTETTTEDNLENEEESVDTEDSEEVKELKDKIKKYEDDEESRKTRMAKQKAKKVQSKSKETDQTQSDPSDFTEGQTALLVAKGIEADAEVELVRQVMEDSGKSMMEVLKLGYFQSELKIIRDDTKVQDATPKGTRRSSSSAKDKVSYWMNKDIKDVPQELRREVVNAKLEKESQKSIFTETPVAGDQI